MEISKSFFSFLLIGYAHSKGRRLFSVHLFSAHQSRSRTTDFDTQQSSAQHNRAALKYKRSRGVLLVSTPKVLPFDSKVLNSHFTVFDMSVTYDVVCGVKAFTLRSLKRTLIVNITIDRHIPIGSSLSGGSWLSP